jgi:uncharacterized membrane protein YbhN (UPF0104 family)
MKFLDWLKEQLLRLARKPGKSRWGAVIIAFAVFVFLGLSLRHDWNTIRAFHWRLNWGYLVIQAILHTLAMGTMFLAWHYTMRRLLNIGQWRTNFRIFSLSMLARRVPVPIWYVGSRVYLYREQQTSATLVLAATALETALIAVTGVLCYVILLPWYSYTQHWAWWIIVALTGIFSLALLFRPGLLIDLTNLALRLFKRPSIPVTITRRDLLLWGSLYLLTWFLDGLGLYYTVAAFMVSPPPVASVIGVSTVSSLVALATMALPTLLLKEITTGALLSVWIPVSAGVVISILYRLLQTIVETLWAFIGQIISKGTP